MKVNGPLQKISKQYLKVEIHDHDSNWKGIEELRKEFKSHQVQTAFEKWAKSNRFSGITSPLYSFLLVADNYLKNAGAASVEDSTSYQETNEDVGLDELCTALCLIGEESFTGRHRAALADLRKTATDKEIKDAYTEFISNCDDFAMKTAVKRFAEGGGKDFINVARERARLIKDEQALQEKLALDFQKKRAEERAAILSETDEIILPEG